MNYGKLLEAVNSGNEKTVVDYLRHEILIPCLDGHENCDVTFHIPDEIRADGGFIKPWLVAIDSYNISKVSDTTYRIDLSGYYTDTLAVDRDCDFSKANVGIRIRGSISVDRTSLSSEVFVTVAEHV